MTRSHCGLGPLTDRESLAPGHGAAANRRSVPGRDVGQFLGQGRHRPEQGQKQGGPDPAQQASDQQKVRHGNDHEAAPVQPGMEQQMSYDSWARIKAACTLDALRGGRSRAEIMAFGQLERGAGSGGRSKWAAPRRSVSPTLLNETRSLLHKAALISTEGKQPKVTATGECGMVDEIRELPWSEFHSKARPDPTCNPGGG